MNPQDKEETLLCDGGKECRCTCHQTDYPLPKDFPTPLQDLHNTFRESEDKRFDELLKEIRFRDTTTFEEVPANIQLKQFLHDSHKRLVERIEQQVLEIPVKIDHMKNRSDEPYPESMKYQDEVLSIINQTLK